jgi:hypothetical protein
LSRGVARIGVDDVDSDFGYEMRAAARRARIT